MKDLDIKLDDILEKHKKIEKKLSDQNNINSDKLIKLNKEYSELSPLVESINMFPRSSINTTLLASFGSHPLSRRIVANAFFSVTSLILPVLII